MRCARRSSPTSCPPTPSARPPGSAPPFRRVDDGEYKRRYVEALGPARCAAIGNGRNDVAMLRRIALGIAIVGPEGASAHAAMAADVLVRSVLDALALLREPRALTATLRP